MQELRIIFPRGDRGLLSVAHVWGYERDDWAIASQKIFYPGNETEAWDYAYELAEQNGLSVEDDRPGKRNNSFLD